MIDYPIFIPSKGRPGSPTTSLLDRHDVEYRIAVEPQDLDSYSAEHPSSALLELPENDRGITFVRNWIKEFAGLEGAERHWQIDDDMLELLEWKGGKRVPADPSQGFGVIETFVDRYSNVAIAGVGSSAFGHDARVPFKLNQQIHSMVLVRSDPFRWRGRGSEDTDYSLQVLASGECTILFQHWQFTARPTETGKGGNEGMYENNGRYENAKWLQRMWGPQVVKISRRRGRVQQDVSHVWRKFQQPLELA